MAGFYENLNKQNYLKIMNGAYQNYGLDSESINQLNGQGDNITPTISLADEIRNASATAEKATAEENHDDDPSWFQKARNFILAPLYGIEEGILNFADGIGDLAMGITGAIAGAVGNHQLETQMKNNINVDWQATVTNATKQLNDTVDFINALDPTSDTRKMWTGQKNGWETLASPEASRQSLNDTKYNAFLSKGAADFVGGVAQGLGEMVPSIVTGKWISGGVNALTGSAKAARTANIVAQSTIGALQGAGKGFSKVAKEDGDLTEGAGYAAIKGVIGGVTRGLSAKFGTFSDRVSNKLAESVTGKVLQSGIEKGLDYTVSANIAGTATQILSDMAVDSATSFGEDLLDPVIKQITYDNEALYKAYGDGEKASATLKNAALSALTSAVTTAIVDGVRTYAEKPDYVKKYLSEHQDVAAKMTDIIDKSRKLKITQGLIEELGDKAPEEMKDNFSKQASEVAEESASLYDTLTNGLLMEKEAYVAPKDTTASENGTAVDTDAQPLGETAVDTDSANSAKVEKASQESAKPIVSDADTPTDTGDRAKTTSSEATGLSTESSSDVDGKAKKEVKIQGTGITEDGKEATIDTKKVTMDQIDMINTVIENSFANIVSVVSLKNGTSFIQYDNGFGYVKKGNTIIGTYTNGAKPDWAQGVKLENMDNVVKEKGEADTIGEQNKDVDKGIIDKAAEMRTTKNGFQNAVGKVIDELFDDPDFKVSKDVKRDIANAVSASYSLDGDDVSVHKTIDSAFDKIMDTPVEGIDGKKTYWDCFDQDEISDMKTKFDRAITETVNKNSAVSERGKMQILNNKLGAVVRSMKERISYMAKNEKQYNSLRNKLNASKQAPTGGMPMDNPNMLGVVSDLGKTLKLSSNNGQFTVNSVRKFIDEHKSIVTDYSSSADGTEAKPAEVSELELTPSGREFIEAAKEMNDYLAENEGMEVLDNEGLRLMNRILSTANIATNENAALQRSQKRAKVEGVIIDASEMSKQFKNGKKFGFVQNTVRSFEGLRFTMKRYLGRGEAYDILVAKPVEDLQNEGMFEAHVNKMLQDQMDICGVKEKNFRGNIDLPDDFTDDNGAKVGTMSKRQLAELYLAEKTSALSEEYEKNGLTIYNSKSKTTSGTIHITQEKAQNLFDANLSESEMKYLDSVFNFVNGPLREKLGSYTLDKYGVDVTEEMKGDYMPDSKDNLRHSVSDKTLKASSLGSTRAIRRTNNKLPSVLGNYDEVIAGYVRDVGQLTMMDNVREYNSIINTKDSYGRSIYNHLSANLPEGAKLMNEWQETVNQISKGDKTPSIFRNAAAVKVITNIGSILKQPLDYFRTMKDVSMGQWLKGLVQGFYVWASPSAHKEFYEYMRQNSKLYSSSENEKWAITENALQGNTSALVDKLGLPMKLSNQLVYAMNYKAYEAKVMGENPSLDPSNPDDSAVIKAKTMDLLDSHMLDNASNSASYDISPVRSGRRTQIIQLVFSMFGGDSQKNLENVDSVIRGNKDSEAVEQGIEESIKKKEDMVDNLQKQNDGIDEQIKNETDEKKAEKLRFQKQNNQTRIDALNESINRSKTQVKAEQLYRSEAKVRNVKIVAGLVASAVLSTLISNLNSVLRGNKSMKEAVSKENLKDMAIDAGFEAGVSWIPFIGTIADAIRNNSDLSPVTLDGINTAISTISTAIESAKAGKISEQDLKKEIRNGINMISNLTGLPVYSLMQYAEGTVANVQDMFGGNGQKTLASIRGYNSAYLTSKTKTYLESGNLTEATKATQANMYFFKGSMANWETSKEITRLGASVSKVPDSLDGVQKERFNSIYKKASRQAEKLVSSTAYKSLTDEDKRSAINYLYSSYFQASKSYVSGEDASSRAGKVLLSYNGNADMGAVSAIIIKCRGKKKEKALAIIARSNLTASQKRLARQLLGYENSII